jgi:diguanylate cyclase (GGDEF)-like protein
LRNALKDRAQDQRKEGQGGAEGSLDLESVLASVKETAYRWDIGAGAIAFAANATSVLGVSELAPLTQARAFALLVAPEHAASRYDAVTGGGRSEPGTQINYRIAYRFLPDGRRGRKSIWLEETGICVIGPDGKPSEAQGTMRVIGDLRDGKPSLLPSDGCDEETGQLNRTKLTEALTAFLADAGLSARHGAFLLLVVNDLTLINETYGFNAGDEVISIVGRRLARVLRGKDRIGRFSSNKFGILLEDCSKAAIETIAQRLIAAVRDGAIDASGATISATVSAGAVLLPAHAADAQAAIAGAMQALDTARNQCADRFALFVPSPQKAADRRHAVAIADEIVHALNDRRMMLALQPIVTSGHRQPELYEGLLRMRRPDGSIVPAAEFMPAAEELGLAKLVDHRALELAVELLRSSPELKLALNVSAATSSESQWVEGLAAFAGKDKSLTERLTIEIAETAAIADVAATTKFVHALKGLGCAVALDNFGADYASYRGLMRLGVDLVKIDGSFIQALHSERGGERFVRTLIDLAKSFGASTVGGWVGDEETARLLERAGIGYMQGYFFGAPELAKPQPDTAKTADRAP